MFGFGKAKHKEISARELADLLSAGKALVVDVREANVPAAGRATRWI